jgi:hypothetical protein
VVDVTLRNPASTPLVQIHFCVVHFVETRWSEGSCGLFGGCLGDIEGELSLPESIYVYAARSKHAGHEQNWEPNCSSNSLG